MGKPVRPDLIQCEINVTPLVDVCLVLLLIFMVVAPLLRGERQVALPETRRPLEMAEEARAVVVAVRADGSLWVESLPVEEAALGETLAQLRAAGPHRLVIVKADRRLRYARVRQILQTVQAAGFGGAALAADRAENPS